MVQLRLNMCVCLVLLHMFQNVLTCFASVVVILQTAWCSMFIAFDHSVRVLWSCVPKHFGIGFYVVAICFSMYFQGVLCTVHVTVRVYQHMFLRAVDITIICVAQDVLMTCRSSAGAHGKMTQGQQAFK
jgi:hypothetical protein